MLRVESGVEDSPLSRNKEQIMEKIGIGIIGGSGIYNLKNIEIIEEINIDTPFGKPSSEYVIAKLNGIRIVFLPRHGRHHTISPSNLNFRANIYGFKKLGVKTLISMSAVGSLREKIKPGHLIFPNQIIDRTKVRESSFFDENIVAHIGFSKPFCHYLNNLLSDVAFELGIPFHSKKCYLCMEGPAFSTKAESLFHRSIDADIIGMTAIPEAKLAREAEMCYGIIAMATDYDSWHESEEAVTTSMVLETLHKNSDTANRMLSGIVKKIESIECECNKSLETAIITDKKYWDENSIKKLGVIIERFL